MRRIRHSERTTVLKTGDGRRASTEVLGRYFRYGTIALVLWSSGGAANAEPQTRRPPAAEQGIEVRLGSGTVTMPIVMVREFPFIEGSMAGVTGKLLLDTGYQAALSVNSHRVPIEAGQSAGTGSFGSGQTFDVQLVPELRDVRIAGLVFPRVTNVIAQEAVLLEGITPDFIGWLGYSAFADHPLELDYRNLQATFHDADSLDYLAGERVVTELSFEIRRLPNIPIMTGGVGDLPVVAAFDTGANGALFTTAAGKAQLLEDGRLTPSQTDPETFDLHGLELNGHAMPVLPGIDVMTEAFPPAAAIGITEPDTLLIGYSLLHQFKTVWDFPQRRIYLLER